VVGHSYIVYAPLLQGCTTVVFEGKPVERRMPVLSAGDRRTQVETLFTADEPFVPSNVTIRRAVAEKLRPKHFRTLFLAGERSIPIPCNGGTASQRAGDRSLWQTETGWAIAANCIGLHAFPVKHGSPTKAVLLGCPVLDEGHHSCKRDKSVRWSSNCHCRQAP